MNDLFSQRNVFADLLRVNKNGEFVYIKYHFLAEHGQKQLSEPEAIKISGEDPDYSKKQLWDAIEEGKEIVWKANVQIMQPQDADAKKLGFDPFDVTKVWPRKQFPASHPHNFLSDPRFTMNAFVDARIRSPHAQQEPRELPPRR